MKWKKALVIAFNTVIAVYLLLAVMAAGSPPERDMVCKGLNVTIEKGHTEGFLTPAEVGRLLSVAGRHPAGHNMADISLRLIEEALERSEFIDHAEAWKTQDGHVCVSVKEQIPVMRVMAGRNDYYVTGDGHLLHDTGYTCDVIIATGSISTSYAERVLAPIGRLITASSFWRNQIEQVHILPDSTVEMVPRVGDHILYLGAPTGVTRKLERLRKFYKYGLPQAGWNNYSRISVEFSNQIVCTKREYQPLQQTQ